MKRDELLERIANGENSGVEFKLDTIRPEQLAKEAEIMPVHRTSFGDLDRSRLENYLRDILHDPEVPETTAAWISRPSSNSKCNSG